MLEPAPLAGVLLPQRPDDTQLTQRRPADIFIPCPGGDPSTMEFVITGPQRTETLTQASAEAVTVA